MRPDPTSPRGNRGSRSGNDPGADDSSHGTAEQQSDRSPASRWRTALPTIATVLGLGATLWATLVGQTVPDLLRSESKEIRTFRLASDRVCGEALATIRGHMPVDLFATGERRRH